MALSADADYTMYLYTCNRCRSCAVEPSSERLSICPSYARMGFFAYSGGGKGYVAQGILEGKVKPTEETAKVAMECLSCGACAQACPPGFDIMSFIRDLRHHLVERDIYANDAHRELVERLRNTGSPWEGTKDRVGLPVYEGQDLLIWAGCRERAKPGVLNSVTAILDAASVSYGVLDKETCCGSPFLDLGDKDGFEKQAEKTLGLLEKASAERTLVLCPHCAAAMEVDYLEVGLPETELVNLPSFLAELVGEDKLELKEGEGAPVTYHDPCRLGRWIEDSDSAREVLSAMNVEVREMERRGEWTHCCGAGGVLAAVAPETSDYASRERAGEARRTGAEKVITSCSYCVSRLNEEKGAPRTMHLADLVAKRLKS